MQGKVGAIAIRLANHEVSSQNPGGRIPNLRPGKYVELAVKDDGSGMDGSTLERIFEPFFTTKTPGDGTGLGLSVVHGIVTEHAGIIHVTSEPGVGSSFHVLLPAFSGSSAEDVEVEPAVVHGNGERILFIDDERTLCNAAQKLLGTLSYVVTAKTSAAEAMQLFRADPTAFDLVITDLTMPGLTGVDVAAQVLLARPGMPVILATGFNADWTLDAIRKLGIYDIVMKPLSLAALSGTIRAALQRAPSVPP
jgi:CheY-like chemotaxis protein